MMSGVSRRVLALVVLPFLLAACRLDVTVDVTIGGDGTGEVVATAVADAELVGKVPGLADGLTFDDAVAAGWTLEGPAPTEGGGLTATLRHGVTSPEDATNLLASLGPPFTGLTLTRIVDGDTTTLRIQGQATFTGGFEAFADSDYLATLGATPFADELAAAGASPSRSVGVTLRATMPGEIVSASGETDDRTITWNVAMDGSATDIAAAAEIRPDSRPGWASAVATVALILLGVWIVVGAALAIAVVRRQRS